jgi:hypothetical protein
LRASIRPSLAEGNLGNGSYSISLFAGEGKVVGEAEIVRQQCQSTGKNEIL